MAAHERVEVLGLPELLLGEALERRLHAAPGLMGGFEQAQAGLVRGDSWARRSLSIERITMSLPPMAMPPPAPATSRAVSPARHRAADHQADAQDGQQEALGGVAGDAAAQLRHVAADDVAGLVGDHADHLVGRLGLRQGAGVDEHVAPVHHEGVEALVPDDAHGDVLRGEPGSPEDGQRVVLEEVLDLGVANQRQPLRGGGRDGGKGGDTA